MPRPVTLSNAMARIIELLMVKRDPNRIVIAAPVVLLWVVSQ